jgi:ABC-2 type transport system ATP-binding protein
MSNIIEVNQLVKHYPGSDQPAVRGLSFAVRRGEVFGLLGPTGAGKTTTLLLLAGLLKSDSGTITIAGGDLSRRSRDLQHLVRLVPQKIALLPGLSLQHNLLWYGWRHGLADQQPKSRCEAALQSAGLAGSCPDRSASSTRWRIGLAAALLHQPEILLLDEPTAQLDLRGGDNLQQIVIELQRRGVTMVYATRHSETAAQLCQRIALIDRGRIVALDTPGALQELVDRRAATNQLDAVFLELTGKQLRR